MIELSSERVSYMRALLVEDNEADARLIKEMLSEVLGAGLHLEHAGRLSDALRRLAAGGIDVILTDLSLPDSQGLEILDRLRASAEQVPVIALIGLDDGAVGIKAVGKGAQDYLIKEQISGSLLARAMRYAVERKRIEEALRESEQKLRLMFDSINDGIAVTDSHGVITAVNQQLLRIHGFTKQEEAIGRRAWDLVAPSGHQKAAAHAALALEKGNPTAVEHTLLRADGSTFQGEVSVSILRDVSGKPVGFIGISRDITERKQAEEALRASEARYRTLVGSLREGVYQSDLEGNFITLNQAGAGIFGFDSPEQMIGKVRTVDLYADTSVRAGVIEEIRRTGSSLREIQVKRRGGLTWILVNNSARRDERGNIIGYEGVFSDVTARKQAEEALQRQNRELTILTRIAQSLSRSVKLKEVLQAALKDTLEAVGVASGSIYLVDERFQEMERVVHEGIEEGEQCAARRIPLSGSVLSKAVETGRVTVIQWPENGSRASDLIQAREPAKIGTCVSVPLRSKGGILGVLNVVSHSYRAFSSEEISLLETIGNQIGVAMENAQLFERITLLSLTDELTTLYNRRHFFETLEVEISRAQRYGLYFSLAMLDLDRFKEYNDRFGHINGDSVLRSFAQILSSTLRKSDTAFRYGGDEFAIIFPQTDAERARKIVDRTRATWLAAPKLQAASLERPPGFSVGVAQFPQDAGSADGLVFLADAALFYSKRHGGYGTTLVTEMQSLSPSSLAPATLEQVYALAATVDARDQFTSGHSKRVAALSEEIGRAAGLASKELLDLQAASLLHDIGKVGVPDSILAKNSGLTDPEKEIMKKHCLEGAQIVSHVRELAGLVPMIRHHHEWCDGTGYPDGLKGEEIPFGARIIAVADAYDTMTAQQPYRQAMSHEKAWEELRREAGTQFDPKLVEAAYQALKRSS